MPFLVSLFFGFVPMFFYAAFVYWLDRYEKEPKALLGAAFFWGVVFAAGGAYILNTVFGIGIYVVTGSESATEFGTASIVAPVIEEILKGLAVGIVFLLFRKEFDSILDGIIYGGLAGLGFAATENTLYIYLLHGIPARIIKATNITEYLVQNTSLLLIANVIFALLLVALFGNRYTKYIMDKLFHKMSSLLLKS